MYICVKVNYIYRKIIVLISSPDTITLIKEKNKTLPHTLPLHIIQYMKLCTHPHQIILYWLFIWQNLLVSFSNSFCTKQWNVIYFRSSSKFSFLKQTWHFSCQFLPNVFSKELFFFYSYLRKEIFFLID